MEHSLKEFDGLGAGVVAVPEYREAEVAFDVQHGLFDMYARQLHMNLEENYGAKVPSLEDLRQYLFLLLYFRVKYVRREKLPFSLRDTKLSIPAFFSQLLVSIGEVVSDEYAVILKPKCDQIYHSSEDKTKSMADEESYLRMVKLSRTFQPFFNASRIVYATEMPRSREGNFSLMALQVIDGKVYSESSKIEPIFAIMTSVLCSTMSQQVLLPRVNYGALQYLQTHVVHIGDYERKHASGGVK